MQGKDLVIKMKYFKEYVSNSYAGTQNHFFYRPAEGEILTGRSFYKISAGGEYNYSLLFSNTIDGTLADGSESHRNLICDGYTIHSAKIGKCKQMKTGEAATDYSDVCVTDFVDVTFDGKRSKEVMPGAFFTTDPVKLYFDKGDFLCLEIEFSGEMIPYNQDSVVAACVKQNDEWVHCKQQPVVSMVGCDREVTKRVAYLGDSITQGVCTTFNGYKQWNALLSEYLGDKYAYWNLGIGYGRASDAATDSAWLYKAKQNDIIFVCFGVNDLYRENNPEKLKKDLTYIVETLKALGKTVIIQTIPPYDYEGELIDAWADVCDYIRTELSKKADLMFDVVPIIGQSDKPNMAKYGGHPNDEGCAAWADELYEKVKQLFAEKQ